jgi:hypothetical protein
MEIYCRKLGHHLSFSYCCREQRTLPCRQILTCWEPYGLHAGHLAHFEQDYFTKTPPDKLNHLVQLVSASKSSNE